MENLECKTILAFKGLLSTDSRAGQGFREGKVTKLLQYSIWSSTKGKFKSTMEIQSRDLEGKGKERTTRKGALEKIRDA